jgi:hypothetical protein
MDAFCLDLSVCERHYSVFREDKWWIVYCFSDPEHAEKFRTRFGGERFNPKDRGRGRMDAVVHDRTLSACSDGRTLMAGRLRDQPD